MRGLGAGMFVGTFRKRQKNSRPVEAGEVLAAVLEGLGLAPGEAGEHSRLCLLWRHWDMVMGPELAPLAHPLGRRHDLLLIGAEDAMLAQELHLMGGEMLERANAFMERPFFRGVKVSLLLGRQGLNRPAPAPSENQGWRAPRAPVRAPAQAHGIYLENMDPASPVARAYARFVRRGAGPLPHNMPE